MIALSNEIIVVKKLKRKLIWTVENLMPHTRHVRFSLISLMGFAGRHFFRMKAENFYGPCETFAEVLFRIATKIFVLLRICTFIFYSFRFWPYPMGLGNSNLTYRQGQILFGSTGKKSCFCCFIAPCPAFSLSIFRNKYIFTFRIDKEFCFYWRENALLLSTIV